MVHSDTIAAVATPSGRGGVSIVRVSGAGVPALVGQLLNKPVSAGQASHRRFLDHDGSTLDDGIALYFAAPNSYTGEHVLELQGHGGRVITDLLLARVLSLDVRLAAPGEFTQRAYLNDKLDLAQAEAVADLIDSQTAAAARSAQRSLRGEFSAHIRTLLEELVQARVWVEAAIDFPEEEIDFLQSTELETRLQNLERDLDEVLALAGQGALLRDGVTLVITGAPNVGKSSLLNRLAGREVAIVTDVAGTTRDLLRESIQLKGIPLEVIDTAGLRETHDRVEAIGVARAREALSTADVLVLIVDDRDGDAAPALDPILERHDIPLVVASNKIDLSNGQAGLRNRCGDVTQVGFCALTGAGLEELIDAVCAAAGAAPAGEVSFIARRRHLDALRRCVNAVDTARQLLSQGRHGELIAEELRLGQSVLGEITGEFSNDDLLGRIFSDFCIGK